MRAWLLGTIFGATSLIVAACGDTEGDDGNGTAGQPTGGSSSGQAGAASAGKAGEPGSGGAASGTGGRVGDGDGGVSSGGSQAGSPSGGSSGSAGATTGGAGGLVDCDPRNILCKRVAPECGAMEVPSVDGSCYGDCVKIERCACDSPDACPDNDQYTCLNSAKHCSPYLK